MSSSNIGDTRGRLVTLATEETEVQCPFCGEPFTIVVDTSVDEQTYVEDCYVCCRPIQFHIRCEEGEVISVEDFNNLMAYLLSKGSKNLRP